MLHSQLSKLIASANLFRNIFHRPVMLLSEESMVQGCEEKPAGKYIEEGKAKIYTELQGSDESGRQQLHKAFYNPVQVACPL